MIGVRIAAKLYDVPQQDGTVTACEAFGENVFLGTDLGLLQKFVVSLENGEGDSSPTIFTTHVKTEAVLDRKKKISRIKHSPVNPCLFVLCARKLMIFDTKDLVMLREIAAGIGCFCCSFVPGTLMDRVCACEKAGKNVFVFEHTMNEGASSPVGMASPPVKTLVVNTDLNTVSSTEANEAAAPATGAAAPDSSSAGVTVSQDSAAAKTSTRASLSEVRPSINNESSPSGSPTNASPRMLHGQVVRQVQSLLLPEPVVTIVEYNGIICVGLHREYSMISLEDGDARSLLALNGQEPYITMADSDAYLRLHNIIFVVSMKAMPSSGSNVLRKTLPFHAEPNCVIVRHPHIFACTNESTEVYSVYDDEVVEQLPIAECAFSTSSPTSSNIFCASRGRLWMLALHTIEAQLHDLVDRYKVDDAFHLLNYCKDRSDSTEREVELHIMAGFAHMYNNAPAYAMAHFNAHVDVREVIPYVPELIPPTATASELQDAEEKAFWEAWEPHCAYNIHRHNIEMKWGEVFRALPPASAGVPKANDVAASPKDARPPREEEELRVDADGVVWSLSRYLQTARDTLKRELTVWLQSRLDTAPPPQRRAIEFALLVLFLGFHDHRSAYALIRREKAMHIRDCRQVLEQYSFWRAFYVLALRKGENGLAEQILRDHLTYGTQPSDGADELAGMAMAVGGPPATTPEVQPAVACVDIQHEVFVAVESCDVTYLYDILRGDPNSMFVTDPDGNSALHVAVERAVSAPPPRRAPHFTLLSLLVDSGVSVSRKNSFGMSALDVAYKYERQSYSGGACQRVEWVIGCLLSSSQQYGFTKEFVAGLAAGSRIARPLYGVQGMDTENFGSWCGFVMPATAQSPAAPGATSPAPPAAGEPKL